MNRCFITIMLAVVATAAAFDRNTRAAEARLPGRPNVLFIAIDDLRDWVGYLHKHPQVKTPNLDRLAGRGLHFTRSYCASPVCNPSRTALLSGLRASTSGVYENSIDWRKVVPDSATTLPLHFKNSGYYVCGAGKIYHDSYRRPSDWDDYLPQSGVDEDELLPGGQSKPKKKAITSDASNNGVGGITFKPLNCDDEDMIDYRSVSYCLKQLNRPHQKPLFVACGLHKPHMPWDVPKKYYAMYPLDQVQLPKVLENDLDDIPPAGVRMARPEGDHAAILKSGRWKDAVQGYLATITFCDAMVGRLIDGFDKSPYKDNTLIVLWSDHGWHLGEKQHWRKFALWEEATRSPLIWVVPGLTKPGSVCDRTVDFMHIYPTLCDLCGLPTPKHVEGQSIRSLLAQPEAPWPQPALTTYKYKNHAVRSEQWRYIRYENGDEELYNDAEDPLEWTNLAMKPQYAPYKSELAKWLPKTDAPWPTEAMGKGAQTPEKREKKAAKQAAKRAGQQASPAK
jgi:arylsulfatase A-like enzyme